MLHTETVGAPRELAAPAQSADTAHDWTDDNGALNP